MRKPGIVVVLLAAAVLGTVLALVAQGSRIVVEDWSSQPVGHTGIPDGWQGQFWGSAKYDFRIVAESPSKALHLKSENEGSTVSKEVKVDVREFPILEWRWKAIVLPKGGDSRRKEADDQACQIYVTFPRFPRQVRSRILSYVWDSTAPAGTVVQSKKVGMVWYVIQRSGPADLGKWVIETRNVFEDFKKIHGDEPKELIEAVSISIDSNDVHGTAECYIGEIVFRKP